MKLFITALLFAISYAQTGTMCGTGISGSTTEAQHSQTYVFTADVSNYIFDTCLTDFDTMLQVLDSNGNELHFNDDHSGECESGNNQYASHLETSELESGKQYKLKINGYCATCYGDFTISVSCPDPCAGINCIAPARCGDGALAPVSPDACCGDANLCPDPCAGVHCFSSTVCDDGTAAPIPEGGCCGDTSLCPVQAAKKGMGPEMKGTYCNQNWHPGDYGAGINGKTVEQCKQDCLDDPNCTGISFSDPFGRCVKCTNEMSHGRHPSWVAHEKVDLDAAPSLPSVVGAEYPNTCPSGYTSQMTEPECRALVGSEVNGKTITHYGRTGCDPAWPPLGTCFEWQRQTFYVSFNCNQNPNYARSITPICKDTGAAEIALNSENGGSAAGFDPLEVLDSTHSAVTMLAFIGAMSLIYHGVKQVHKVVCGTNDFQKMKDDEF